MLASQQVDMVASWLYICVYMYYNVYYCMTSCTFTVLPNRAKHLVKVHIWAGITLKGAMQVCIFDGIMDADLYIDILQQTLLPFIRDNLQDHRFMQDNDPKHTSRKAGRFMVDNGINWWKTPPESPDINPIENLWHELRVH